MTYRESHIRSLLKALSWRVLGTVSTTLLVFVFTRRISLSLAIGGVEFVSKILLFWLHERVWDSVRFGIREDQVRYDQLHLRAPTGGVRDGRRNR